MAAAAAPDAGAESQGLMLLHIRSVGGDQELKVRSSPSVRIQDLMTELERPLITPFECQRWVFEGRLLEPQKLLREEGLQDGACITLVRLLPKAERLASRGLMLPGLQRAVQALARLMARAKFDNSRIHEFPCHPAASSGQGAPAGRPTDGLSGQTAAPAVGQLWWIRPDEEPEASMIASIGTTDDRESFGSSFHGMGKCIPCAELWQTGTCSQGRHCPHCHRCIPDRYEGRARRRSRLRRRPKAAASSPAKRCIMSL